MEKLPSGPGDRSPEIVASASITFAAALISVACRFLCRWKSLAGFWYDDWLALAALVYVTPVWALSVTLIQDFVGRHIGNTDLSQIGAFGKAYFYCELAQPICLTLIKCSILALYWRIFSVAARWPMIGMLAAVLAWGVVYFFILAFQCQPISGAWDLLSTSKKCLDTKALFVYGPIPHIIEDFILLAIPLPFIARLPLHIGQRLAIYSMFLLGGFVTVISIYRTIRIQMMDVEDVDFTWAFTDATIWAMVEINVAIVCACLPSLRPLVRYMGSGSFTRASSEPATKETPRATRSARPSARQSWWSRMDSAQISVPLSSFSNSDHHEDGEHSVSEDDKGGIVTPNENLGV